MIKIDIIDTNKVKGETMEEKGYHFFKKHRLYGNSEEKYYYIFPHYSDKRSCINELFYGTSLSTNLIYEINKLEEIYDLFGHINNTLFEYLNGSVTFNKRDKFLLGEMLKTLNRCINELYGKNSFQTYLSDIYINDGLFISKLKQNFTSTQKIGIILWEILARNAYFQYRYFNFPIKENEIINHFNYVEGLIKEIDKLSKGKNIFNIESNKNSCQKCFPYIIITKFVINCLENRKLNFCRDLPNQFRSIYNNMDSFCGNKYRGCMLLNYFEKII